ncbi:MAG: T9SS type A sorting domain-containing protein [Ignavibacteriae bacterium]|nr:T9SS type A sorting domain-containing protein [Ignavibacteriota bacterium]
MKKINTIILLLFFVVSANAVMRNVPAQYSSIQSAINASSNGDTILVDQGTYYENINFYGRKIVVTSRFYISNNLAYIQNTIINGSTPSNPDSASCVRFHNGEDSTTVLQGFTITGGTGTKWLDEHGAGVYREGGGILIAFCAPLIQNNIIKYNEAINYTGGNGAGGGGIRIGDGNPKILDNIIIYNKGLYGAGIVLNYTGVTVKNNLICYNSQSSTYSSGAGIWANNVLSGKPRLIENNTIIHNSSATGTAGVLSIYSSNLILRNNIIWGNTSQGGPQILTSNGGVVTVSYCCVQGGYTGTGNISSYPQFADTNYILTDGSPCIDAGDTSSVFNDPANPGNPLLAKFPAKGGRRCDMGAYGGPGSTLLSGASVIGIKNNNLNNPEGFLLYQNYPNPFNPSTIIKYSIPSIVSRESSIIKLVVFDILGKEIVTLVNQKQGAGTYEVQFPNNSITKNQLSSGIYFYRLTAGNFTIEKKMILIK